MPVYSYSFGPELSPGGEMFCDSNDFEPEYPAYPDTSICFNIKTPCYP